MEKHKRTITGLIIGLDSAEVKKAFFMTIGNSTENTIPKQI